MMMMIMMVMMIMPRSGQLWEDDKFPASSLILTKDTRTQQGGIKWLRSKAELDGVPGSFLDEIIT